MTVSTVSDIAPAGQFTGMGIKDCETWEVRAVPVPETTAARLVRYIESNVAKGARTYTDEHKSYSGLENH